MQRNLGKVSVNPTGDWSESTVYNRLDIVRHNGASYMALQSNQNSEPTGETNADWMLLNEDGKTPVYGVDYWTEADIQQIKDYVNTAILGGEW